MRNRSKTDSVMLKGKDYWRSLDQLAEMPEFRELVEREFPEGASELTNPMTRRRFLSLMGASLGLAGLAGCRRPVEKIIPYVAAPEEVIPGVPQHYATTMPLGNSASGLVVECHEGRPTKVEGNELHPSSLGGSNLHQQAAILGLYDPDRSKRYLHDNIESSRADFITFWRQQAADFASNGGSGLAVLSESFASPTLARLRSRFLAAYPQARWVTYEAVSDENIYQGTEAATGAKLRPLYDLAAADVILSLDSDFLQTESESITSAKGFAAGRRIKNEHDSLNRLYAVESVFSLTGAMADHRLRLKSSLIGAFLAALALELQNYGASTGIANQLQRYGDHSFDRNWLRVVARDLAQSRGRGLVIAGRRQPAAVHALAFAVNSALGDVGSTVSYHDFTDTTVPDRDDLASLVSEMKVGSVTTLVVIGGNPVYDAGIELDFAAALGKVGNSVHLSSYLDETSRLCGWHLPRTHFLEEWGDARAANGTASVVQPLIAPLYNSVSPVELLALLSSGRDRRGYEVVREIWQKLVSTLDFEKQWRRVLHDGLLAGSAIEPQKPSIATENLGRLIADAPLATESNDLELVFTSSAKLFDGRFANNGWLQELPDPVTKISWDNAAIISPATAKELGLNSRDLVRLTYQNRTLKLPVWVLPGQADGSIALDLGYGRSGIGRVADGVGFNAYSLRTGTQPDFVIGVGLVKTGAAHEMANTQDHNSMEGRPLVREATLSQYRQHPEFASEMVEHPPLKSLWQEHSYDEGYQWGMTIDLNLCTGCNACVIACQSENNIPVIGKEQVGNGREMHWLRTDRYFAGSPDQPEMVHQPVACVHCENAPCEQVCPVQATVHDGEGLNVMVYNRCIGTRYCSNNCPYKVRRFNFFNYTGQTPESLKMANNPDVTVRSRGVMEKCTYCLQRISRAKIKAKLEEREVRDGEVVTACQQACPVGAITFGNINDRKSRVTRMKKQNRRYELLAELNVKPRTSYLAKIRNPNPELESDEQES